MIELRYPKVSMKLDSDMIVLLRRHAETTGRSQSHILRLALIIFLETQPKPEKVREYLDRNQNPPRWQASFTITKDLLDAIDAYVFRSGGALSRSDVMRYALHTYLHM